MAKWVAQIDSADRIPELVARAFHVATAGRPGPVVLALPEDMLVEQSDAADAEPYAITRVHPAAQDVERARKMLDQAERPLVIVGGAPWGAEAHAALTAWCERGCAAGGGRLALPGLRRQHVGDVRGPSRPRARPAPRAACADADVLLVIGDRLSEITTSGYTILEAPEPRAGADPRERRPGRARARLLAGARDRRLAGCASRSRSQSSRLSIRRRGRPRTVRAQSGVPGQPPPPAGSRRARHG